MNKRFVFFFRFFVIGILIAGFVTSCDEIAGWYPLKGTSPIKDIDGNAYDTIVIGTQTWMVQNLRTTHYRNGDKIEWIPDENNWAKTIKGAYCNYDNSSANSLYYGRIYNHFAVLDSRNIAPVGWRVADIDDWTKLRNYLIKNGYNYDGSIVGNKVGKSLASRSGWNEFTTEDTSAIGSDQSRNNSSKFNAFPGGGRDVKGKFKNVGRCAYFRTAVYWVSCLNYDSDSISFAAYGSNAGFPVRCIKDTIAHK